MAQFRGTLMGNRGMVSRLGSKSSGMIGNVASWAGSIETRLYVNSDGADCFEIWQAPHHGRGINRMIARGRVGGSIEIIHQSCIVYRLRGKESE